MKTHKILVLALGMVLALGGKTLAQKVTSWTPDNGDGTYTNPVFFEDTPDPCMIRVGTDYYLTCSSMHMMPGLPIYHSKDLINWKLISYCFDKLDLGPEYRLENDEKRSVNCAYGWGIWAPTFAYDKKNKTYHVMANVNGYGVQAFEAKSPYGPWKSKKFDGGGHDLSLFFDDNGKVYVTWGFGDIYLAEVDEGVTRVKKETTINITDTTRTQWIGCKKVTYEGGHIHKINGKYIITLSIPGDNTGMCCAISDNIHGPYVIKKIINEDNHMGVYELPGLKSHPFEKGKIYHELAKKPFEFWEHRYAYARTAHQGGLIDTPSGEWWGYVAHNHNASGRLTIISPIWWGEDGFPYFGVKNNIGHTPRKWYKPNCGIEKTEFTPVAQRNDNFDKASLNINWQWNHVPNNQKWSLTEEPGKLRLHSMPSRGFWLAKNTLSQRNVGTENTVTVELEFNGLKEGDIAGLGALQYPYAWIGVTKDSKGLCLKMYNGANFPSWAADDSLYLSKGQTKVLLRGDFDYTTNMAYYSYSLEGKTLKRLGKDFHTLISPFTYLSVRYSLFNFNTKGIEGGYADFDNFTLDEKYVYGQRRSIPYGKNVRFQGLVSGLNLKAEGKDADVWKVIKRPYGCVALKQNGKFVSVAADGSVSFVQKEKISSAETFMWSELETGELLLMSMKTNRYLSLDKNGHLQAWTEVPLIDPNKDLIRFNWKSID